MLTKTELKRGLVGFGVKPGMTLEVHSALSSFGPVEGGAITVIEALKETVTESGSIFMPALRLSRELELTEADKELGLVEKIKILPPDCEHSAMGAIADAFRRLPDTCTGNGVFRISGWGAHGREAAKGGLQYVLDNDGYALLFGVDIYKLTAMHYVEERLPQAIKDIFAPNAAARAAYPPDEWFIETGRPPVKAWYAIQRQACEKGLIQKGVIGRSHVMFFKVWDVVGLYAAALQDDPYALYGVCR